MTRQRFFGWLAAVAAATTMTAACAQSDVGVTTAVKSRLAADDTVKAYRIDVDTKDRVVTLRGEVDTEVAKTKAVQLARSTNGVRDVVDGLVVAPGATPTTGVDDEAQRRAREAADKAGTVIGDAGITAAIKTKMLADATVGGLKIDVDTTDGAVILTGNVNSAGERKRAIELAKETDGVKSVKDQLKIVK
jgi:hyperosmotically inducible periplasmic protein